MTKRIKKYYKNVKTKIKKTKISDVTLRDIIFSINKFECMDLALEQTKYFVTIYNVDEFRNYENLEEAFIKLYEAASKVPYKDTRTPKYYICKGKQIFRYNDFMDFIDVNDNSSQITKFLLDCNSNKEENLSLEVFVNCKISKKLLKLSNNAIIAKAILQVAYVEVLNKYFEKFKNN